MPRLHRYIFRQLAVAFLLSSVGMVFIAMPGIAVGAVHKFGGAGMLSVLKILPLMVAVFVPYVLPVALLLALVSVHGRLAEQNEWTAIRMAGVSPWSMLTPSFLLALLAGTGVYLLHAEVLPWIHVRNKTIQLDELKQALKNLSRGRTEVQIGDFQLSSTYRDPDDHQSFYDCLIELPPRGDEPPRSFLAEAVRFEFTDTHMTAHLFNARGTQEGVNIDQVSQTSVSVALEELTGKRGRHDFSNPRYMSAGDRLRAARRIEDERRTLPYALVALGQVPTAEMYASWDRRERRLLHSWHECWSSAATCLMFVLVGVSTGLLLRRGTQLTALGAAVGYAMLYWIASLRLGKQLARDGVVEPWVGAWVPLLVFALFGLWMTRRAFRV